MSARRTGGGGGPLLTVLVLGTILAGLVYTFWGQIKRRLMPPETQEVAEPAPPTRPAPAERDMREARVAEAPAEVPRPEPVPATGRGPSAAELERRRADTLRRRAESALRELDFDLASELFGREADVLGHDAGRATEARGFAAKARTFSGVTSGLKANPESSGQMVTLKRHGASDLVNVVLVDETDDTYLIARRGMQFEIARHEVASVVRMSPVAQRERLLRDFEKVERASTDRTGAGCFALAERAVCDGLKGKALEYLEKAYSRDGQDLPRRIRVSEAKKFLGLAIWCESTGRTKAADIYCLRVQRKYSDLPELVAEARELMDRTRRPVAVAANYKPTVEIRLTEKPGPANPAPAASPAAAEPEPSPKEEEATVIAEEVKSDSAKNAKLVPKMNNLFQQGMDHYVKGRPGNPNSNRHLKEAVNFFEKVIALCDRALKNDPRNAKIESRQADAARFAYHARKMQTLNLFN